ncbi:MAG TPA: hypothetical protein DD400_03710 [Rhodospirillaceae bacterium]|nr:hypothetical protein [Rhodospirillaceae bacterium]
MEDPSSVQGRQKTTIRQKNTAMRIIRTVFKIKEKKEDWGSGDGDRHVGTASPLIRHSCEGRSPVFIVSPFRYFARLHQFQEINKRDACFSQA